MHPDAFKRLKNVEMSAELKRLDLSSGGKKLVMVARHLDWWTSQQAEDNGGVESAAESSKLDPITPQNTSIGSFPSNVLSTLLLRKNTAVSHTILRCVEKLGYPKAADFIPKDLDSDLSAELKEVEHFVEQWIHSQDQTMKNTPSIRPGLNLLNFEKLLNSRVVSLGSSQPVVHDFFAKWGIKHVRSRSNTPRLASLGEGAAPQQSIDALDTTTALEKELDVLSNAMHYRLAMWMSSFPEEGPNHVKWPFSFTKEEKTKIRTYLKAKMDRNPEMWAHGRSKKDLIEDVEDMRESAQLIDFPVPKGASATVIHQVVGELRNDRTRSESRSQIRSESRRQARVSPSPSRSGIRASASPDLKRKRIGNDFVGGDEGYFSMKRPDLRQRFPLKDVMIQDPDDEEEDEYNETGYLSDEDWVLDI